MSTNYESAAEQMSATLAYAQSRISKALKRGYVLVGAGGKYQAIGMRGPSRRDPCDKSQRKTTPEERADIAKMWRAGATMGEIRKKHGREHAGVIDILKREGIDPSARAKRPTIKGRAGQLLAQGKSAHEVAQSLHCGLIYVQAIARALEPAGRIAPRPKKQRENTAIRNRKALE